MNVKIGRGGWVLSLVVLVASVSDADDFDYEINLGFDRTSLQGRQLLATPNGAIVDGQDVDTDDLSLSGTWYYGGLSDGLGPRARAAFVDRASSLSVSYVHKDQSTASFRTNEDPLSPFLPFDVGRTGDGDSFATELRYVDRDSGWFGGVGWLTSDFRGVARDGTSFSTNDADVWDLSVGKYLFETTALTLRFSEVDNPGSFDTSTVAAEVTHLGSLGERWQYAVDFGYGRSDRVGSAHENIWAGTVSLYPTRDFEFGLSVEHISVDGRGFIVDPDTTALEGFASWFVTPNVQLSASYRVDDVDFVPGTFINDVPRQGNTDQDSFGISATVRF